MKAINSLPDTCAIDAVINNAGLALGKGPFQESQPEDWDTMLTTNVTGLLTVTHGILHKLKVSDHPHIITSPPSLVWNPTLEDMSTVQQRLRCH